MAVAMIVLALDMDIDADDGWTWLEWFELQNCWNIVAGKEHHGSNIMARNLQGIKALVGKETNKVASASMNLLSSTPPLLPHACFIIVTCFALLHVPLLVNTSS